MDAEALFDEMAAKLVPRGASTGAMFGSRALKLADKVFATSGQGRIVVKLGAGTPPHASALEIGEPFDPSGKGRPMKEWIVFDDGQDPTTVAGFVEAAYELALSRRA
ncbi:hypothetical protein [Aeromicrobium panaciterrae]|uniref:hypothetical protein n=1 Tax=Aeromicrobium panaciterrae TaxID=363861 RepID=UPI0031DE633C